MEEGACVGVFRCLCKMKRDSVIEKKIPLKGYRHWPKVRPLYHDWLRSLNQDMVNCLSCMEGKGGLKDI